jgi:putative IMPACT (imprinted ancient) family translation regulator
MTGTLLTDTQLLESYNDDGEKFGGERVLKALREGQGVDVLTVCCRWYGGEMIGVSTFQSDVGLLLISSLFVSSTLASRQTRP